MYKISFNDTQDTICLIYFLFFTYLSFLIFKSAYLFFVTHPLTNVIIVFQKSYLLSIEMVLKGVRLELKPLCYASCMPARTYTMARCMFVHPSVTSCITAASKPDDRSSRNRH